VNKVRELRKRDPKVTSRIMSSIKGKDTKPELLLRRRLWREGYRYRVNYKKLPGKPDIVFTKKKVAIFVDGDFWHGNNWRIRGLGSLEEELSGYTDFWREKITRNIKRDEKVSKELREMGWIVLRVWESDVKKNLDDVLERIKAALGREGESS
jgi:DNA mismatch endonuclease (patch repair protein)